MVEFVEGLPGRITRGGSTFEFLLNQILDRIAREDPGRLGLPLPEPELPPEIPPPPTEVPPPTTPPVPPTGPDAVLPEALVPRAQVPLPSPIVVLAQSSGDLPPLISPELRRLREAEEMMRRALEVEKGKQIIPRPPGAPPPRPPLPGPGLFEPGDLRRIGRAVSKLPKGAIAEVIVGSMIPGELGSGELNQQQVLESINRFKKTKLGQKRVAVRGPGGVRAPKPVSEPLVINVRRGRQTLLDRIRGALTSRIGKQVALGVGAAIIARRLTRSGTSTLPTAPVGPGAAPLTPAQPLPLPSGGTLPQLLPGITTGANVCETPDSKKKKKKKRRKCRARANVVWAGGRKKGQKAGSKCIAFEKR